MLIHALKYILYTSQILTGRSWEKERPPKECNFQEAQKLSQFKDLIMAIFQVLCSLRLQGESIGFGGIGKQSLEKLVPMSDQSLRVNYALHLEK